MQVRFGQFNQAQPSQTPAGIRFGQSSGGTLTQPACDSFTPRFAGESCTNCGDKEDKTPFMTELSDSSRVVTSQLRKTGHLVGKTRQNLLWESSLAELLLNTEEVKQYLTSQQLDPEKMQMELIKIFSPDEISASSVSPMGQSLLNGIVEDIKNYAKKEHIETITPVVIWRWLMKGANSRFVNAEHHSDLIAALSQGKTPESNKLLAAPDVQSGNTFADWYINNYKPILGPDDPRIKEAEALQPELLSRVYGQDGAVNLISDSVFNGITGYPNRKKPHRPIARIMAMGPTGSGKTYTPEQLGEILGRRVITVSCNELHDATGLGKLVGAGPGYAGHDSKNFVDELIEANRAMMEDGEEPPIIIFDEIEKADPKVQELLMTFLDKGVMAGSDRSKIGYGSGSIVFLTSNLGQTDMNELKEKGATKEQIADAALKALDKPWLDVDGRTEKRFKPEFLARIDKRLVYSHIDQGDAERALDAKLDASYIAPAKDYDGCEMIVSPEVRDIILREGYSWKLGLRVLEDAVDQFFTPFNEERLRLIKEGQLKPGQKGGKMFIDVDNGALKLRYEPPARA